MIFCVMRIFKNCNYKALNLSFKNVITVGRLKCCGMEYRWLWLMTAGRQKRRGKCCGLWRPGFPIRWNCIKQIKLYNYYNQTFYKTQHDNLFTTKYNNKNVFLVFKTEYPGIKRQETRKKTSKKRKIKVEVGRLMLEFVLSSSCLPKNQK